MNLREFEVTMNPEGFKTTFAGDGRMYSEPPAPIDEIVGASPEWRDGERYGFSYEGSSGTGTIPYRFGLLREEIRIGRLSGEIESVRRRNLLRAHGLASVTYSDSYVKKLGGTVIFSEILAGAPEYLIEEYSVSVDEHGFGEPELYPEPIVGHVKRITANPDVITAIRARIATAEAGQDPTEDH